MMKIFKKLFEKKYFKIILVTWSIYLLNFHLRWLPYLSVQIKTKSLIFYNLQIEH